MLCEARRVYKSLRSAAEREGLRVESAHARRDLGAARRDLVLARRDLVLARRDLFSNGA